MSRKPEPKKPCIIAGCDQFGMERRMCHKHYQRWKVYGYGEGEPRPEGNSRGPIRRSWSDPKFQQRFWGKVALTADDTRCWEWQGHRLPSGYGVLSCQNHPSRAARLAWAIANGRMPVLDILHSCDNPPCVNPNHLREGTHKENMQDMVKRGRHHTFPKGEQHKDAVLTEAQVLAIRAAWIPRQAGLAQSLADKYGVSIWTLRQAANRHTWKHLP